MRFIRNNWWKIIVFLIYIIFLGILVPKHEPWFDEAQAWLLARDSSLIDLLVKYLRYEGSPGLWHLLLILPAKLGLPYSALNITSGLLAAMGVFLFLWYSPFPPVIKILYPFSFFTFYQYAVVARSYALLPVLLFSVAITYKNKAEKPFLFILFLILLANVSFHGVIIAVVLFLIHILDINKLWYSIKASVKYKQLIAASLFCFVILLIKLQLEPPRDLISVAGFNKDLSGVYDKGISIFMNALAVDRSISGFTNNNVFYTLCNILSKFTIILTLFWLILRKKLFIFITAVFALFIFFSVIYAHVWHQGVLFFTWLFVLWLSFENLNKNNDKITRFTKWPVILTIAAVMSIQIYWSFSSFKYDYSKNYSASKSIAKHIKENKLENKKIYAINFHSISILPYFSHNIFCNYNDKQQPSFWIWSGKNSMYREPYLSLTKYNPDIIILGIKSYSIDEENIEKPFVPEIPGYNFSKLFAAALYWKDGPLESDSFILYEKIIP
jgi:hypothetical protein